MFDARRAEFYIVPCIRFLDAHMVRDTQPELVRLVLGGGHDVALHAEELHAVSADLFEMLDPRARLGGVLRRGILREHRIGEDARGDDLAARRAVAQRNDAGVERHPLAARALEMSMRVEQSGEDVLSGGIDLHVACGAPRAAAVERDRIEVDDVRDDVAGEHDGGGPARGSTVAIDDHRVADHEARGPHAVRDTFGLRGERCEWDSGRRDCGGRPENAGENHRAAPIL